MDGLPGASLPVGRTRDGGAPVDTIGALNL